jgi:AcrR family transcriptional regulator
MPLKIPAKKPKPSPPKRKPGEKAGLSRATIVAKAIVLIKRDPNLTIMGIASALKVSPNAIYAHFPGKLPEIFGEMFRILLADVARPFPPNEKWEDYLRDLFAAVSSAFHQHTNLAQAAPSALSADYYINPLLPERILVALAMAGLGDGQRANTLDLVMASLIGFLAIEYPALDSHPVEWVDTTSARIDALPAGEHPQIKLIKSDLVRVAGERASQIQAAEPSLTRAHRFADSVIARIELMKLDAKLKKP